MCLFAEENANQIQRLFAVEQGKRLVFIYDCSAEAHTLDEEEALKGGMSRVIIADGRIQNPISNALAGNGTTIQ